MSSFPKAIHVVQRDEIRYALWPDGGRGGVYCQNDFADIRKFDVMEIDGVFDLFNDGTLRLLRTAGHTCGHQALLLNLPHRGQVCLGGDIGHQPDGFEAMVPMPWDWSTSAISLTRMRMKHLARSGVPVFLWHEAQDFGIAKERPVVGVTMPIRARGNRTCSVRWVRRVDDVSAI
jgi:glyoxylase-like metal-dependent hydrolase (beta-lactamase superfamily II)